MNSDSAPTPGTIRYLCPLECGWHYDETPSVVDMQGLTPDSAAATPSAIISSLAGRAAERALRQVEEALRDHLATHTTEQFVRQIQTLRAEVASLRGVPA